MTRRRFLSYSLAAVTAAAMAAARPRRPAGPPWTDSRYWVKPPPPRVPQLWLNRPPADTDALVMDLAQYDAAAGRGVVYGLGRASGVLGAAYLIVPEEP